MKELTRYQGLPVIAVDDGEEIGTFMRFIVDPSSDRIVGLAVTGPAWYSEPSFVALPDVVAFGADAIMVRVAQAAVPVSQSHEARPYLDNDAATRSRRALSLDGAILGTIRCGAFDDRTGEVTEYHLEPASGDEPQPVARSAFVSSGRDLVILQVGTQAPAAARAPEVPAPRRSSHVSPPGRDEPARAAARAPESPEATSQSAADGQSPKSVIPESVIQESVNQEPVLGEANAERNRGEPRLSPVAAEGLTPRPPSGDEPPIQDQLKEAINQNEALMVPLVNGKYADRDLLDDNGATIAARGQLITAEIAEAARRASKLYDLWVSAQSEPPEAA